MFLNPGKGSSATLSFFLPEHEHFCMLLLGAFYNCFVFYIPKTLNAPLIRVALNL